MASKGAITSIFAKKKATIFGKYFELRISHRYIFKLVRHRNDLFINNTVHTNITYIYTLKYTNELADTDL